MTHSNDSENKLKIMRTDATSFEGGNFIFFFPVSCHELCLLRHYYCSYLRLGVCTITKHWRVIVCVINDTIYHLSYISDICLHGWQSHAKQYKE